MSYKHLSLEERHYIEIERKLGTSMNEIASVLGRAQSTLIQYFPKSMRLDKLSEKEVLSAVNEMNHRPRKCLGFKTPWEVFAELTQIDTNFKTNVALMT